MSTPFDTPNTPVTPELEPGSFAVLRVADVNRIGAFLDWGQPKELFVPFAEQTKSLKPDDEVLVYLYIDNTQRLCASMRVERNLDSAFPEYQIGDSVELVVISKTEMGVKALVDGRYIGLIYKDEIFKPLSYAQPISGFIKKVRDDGKIDLQLTDPLKSGHRTADPVADQILERLAESDGFLPINDKTQAEEIYEWFGVSRKKFKIALGSLYKKRLITVDDDGIRLVK